jgi:transposase-like protein/IS1 family transposase
MLCPTCQIEARKFGKDRSGNQRWQCKPCKTTWTEKPAALLDDMRLPLDKALDAIRHLTEGCSVRSTSRLCGVAKGTVLSLLVCVGEKCEAFLADRLTRVKASNVQADEIWGFVRMKEKQAVKQNAPEDVGDAYCYVAIERHTKLILAWHLGKRDGFNTIQFVENVEKSTRGHFQIDTDGWRSYPEAISVIFESEGRTVDHAAVIKTYGKVDDDHRYSPSAVLTTEYKCCSGNPDLKKACTSHVERQNLEIRMKTRRMTRLTNAFSKKWDNHRYALALHFATINFVTPHGTLTKEADGVKTTPAMAAGLTDRPWTLRELLAEATASTH